MSVPPLFEPTLHSPVPAGFHVEWHQDPAWRTGSTHRCRFPNCGGIAVAEFDRGYRTDGDRRPSWWAYCPDHLYGRTVHDGAVWHPRLVADT